MARSVRGSGRPLEAAGNGGPRWMITARFVRVQDPAYRSALSTSSEQPRRAFSSRKLLQLPADSTRAFRVRPDRPNIGG